ncbi:hypothetical protein [Novosphingobium sp. NBM11]|uniref:hypothetical protein n=1 Tax=Novosphingobium sp. NBM11 TaxID=2596914 RepID=UPI0021068E10|nr:hypothetical protein [Novosphingobium sp. NBM11]
MSLPDPIAAGAGLRKWSPLLGPAISLAILGAVLLQLRELNWSMIWSIIPRSPLVWLVLAASYFAAPAADWLIFRRLWNIPAAGFIPLVKKMIGNELLLGYVGEVYFYDWARKHVKMEGSPFGAVKDVAILSALAGNILTLAMLALAWPLIGLLGFGKDGNLMAMSIGIVLLTSLVIMFFPQRAAQPAARRTHLHLRRPLPARDRQHRLRRARLAPDPAGREPGIVAAARHDAPADLAPAADSQQGHRLCRRRHPAGGRTPQDRGDDRDGLDADPGHARHPVPGADGAGRGAQGKGGVDEDRRRLRLLCSQGRRRADLYRPQAQGRRRAGA